MKLRTKILIATLAAIGSALITFAIGPQGEFIKGYFVGVWLGGVMMACFLEKEAKS